MGKSNELPNYGGQALIEGILMRGRSFVVAAFRKSDGEIVLDEEKLTGISKTRLAKLPLIRGLIILWDSLSLGIKYLTISANHQSDEAEEKIEGFGLFITLIVSLSLSISLFFVLPSLLVACISKIININTFLINLLEGIIRIVILILYLVIVGRTEEIKRVFAYHGAEHKTINAFEHGESINTANIKKYPLAHARCGTSFLLTLVLLSVVIYSLLGPMPLITRVLSRILFIPFIAMISYELIRWMGNNEHNPVIKLLTKPNLLLQKLTTQEPTVEMIEVAVTAFNRLVELENN